MTSGVDLLRKRLAGSALETTEPVAPDTTSRLKERLARDAAPDDGRVPGYERPAPAPTPSPESSIVAAPPPTIVDQWRSGLAGLEDWSFNPEAGLSPGNLVTNAAKEVVSIPLGLSQLAGAGVRMAGRWSDPETRVGDQAAIAAWATGADREPRMWGQPGGNPLSDAMAWVGNKVSQPVESVKELGSAATQYPWTAVDVVGGVGRAGAKGAMALDRTLGRTSGKVARKVATKGVVRGGADLVANELRTRIPEVNGMLTQLEQRAATHEIVQGRPGHKGGQRTFFQERNALAKQASENLGGIKDPKDQERFVRNVLGLEVDPIGPAEVARMRQPVEKPLPRTPHLFPEKDRELVHEASIRMAERNLPGLVDQYLELNGSTINPDEARPLFPWYDASPDARTRYAFPVHEASSTVADAAYKRLLEQPPGPGQSRTVLMVGGGAASGKTTALKAMPDLIKLKEHSKIVVDKVFKNVKGASRDIDAALDSGHDVMLVYVVRDPRDAMHDMMKRAAKEGRTVPASAFLEGHMGSLPTGLELADKYKSKPNVEVRFIDNRMGGGKAKDLTRDEVRQIVADRQRPGFTDDLKRDFNLMADRKFLDKEVNKHVYLAATESGPDRIDALTHSRGAGGPGEALPAGRGRDHGGVPGGVGEGPAGSGGAGGRAAVDPSEDLFERVGRGIEQRHAREATAMAGKPEVSAGFERGLRWYRNLAAQEQADLIAADVLNAEQAHHRAYQPQRIEAFGASVARVMEGAARPGSGVDRSVAAWLRSGDFAAWKKEVAAAAGLPPSQASDAIASAIRDKPKLVGQRVEEWLGNATGTEPMPGKVKLESLPKDPAQRQAWQLKREEFNALPAETRKARIRELLPKVAKKADRLSGSDDYASIVSNAARKGRPVPKEVLDQDPGFWKAAMQAPSRLKASSTDELAKAAAAEGRSGAVYFPMLKRIRPSDFMPSFGVKRVKPGMLKRSTGKLYAEDRFIKDPAVVASQHTAQVLKWKNAEQTIKDLIANGKRIGLRKVKSMDDLGPGEELFAPDGFLRIFRSQVDFGDKVLEAIKSGGDADDALAVALRSMVQAGEFDKAAMGIAQAQKYAVPKGVMDELRAQFVQMPQWVRTMFDRPTDYWRATVLPLRPAWLINNAVGNVVLSTMNGVGPREYAMALLEKYRAKTPGDIAGVSLTASEMQKLNLGRAESTRLGQALTWLENTGPAQAVGRGVDFMTGLNAGVEGYFRTANWLKSADRVVRAKQLQATGAQMLKAYDLLDELDHMTPPEAEQAIREVNYFMNDYAALHPFERHVLRRVVPFYSFMKFQARLWATLPVDYPGRGAMLSALGKFGNEAALDSEPLPPYMRNRGLVDTGVGVTVDGQEYRAFMSTAGLNPLIPGAIQPEGGEISADPRNVVETMSHAANPALQYGIDAVRGGPQIGQAFTEYGTVEVDGQFYKLDEFGQLEKTQRPMPSTAEHFIGRLPQVQLATRLINPDAGFTADPMSPVSAKSSSSVTRRTRGTELLRYFAGIPIVLVNLDKVDAGDGNPRSRRSAMRKLMRQKAVAGQ